MAKSQITTPASPMAALAKERQSTLAVAIRDSRDLSASELSHVEALDTAIAHSKAVTRREAAEQVRVARETLELLCHDGTAPAALELAYTALCSAREVLGP